MTVLRRLLDRDVGLLHSILGKGGVECSIHSAPCWRGNTHSFRQPRLAQALCPPGEVFQSSERLQILEIGNAKRGIDLAQTRHGLLRLGETPHERSACGGYACCDAMIVLPSE